jgi:hypothetical protein
MARADQQGRLPPILEAGNGEHGDQENGQLTQPGLRRGDDLRAFVDGQQVAQICLPEENPALACAHPRRAIRRRLQAHGGSCPAVSGAPDGRLSRFD